MKLNEAVEKLNSTLKNFEAKTRQIKQERENLAADLQEKIKALNQATKTITELKKIILKAEAKNKNMGLQLKKKENAGSSNQIKQLKSIINSLESEKNKLLEKIAQLQSNFRAQPEKRKPAAETEKEIQMLRVRRNQLRKRRGLFPLRRKI